MNLISFVKPVGCNEIVIRVAMREAAIPPKKDDIADHHSEIGEQRLTMRFNRFQSFSLIANKFSCLFKIRFWLRLSSMVLLSVSIF